MTDRDRGANILANWYRQRADGNDLEAEELLRVSVTRAVDTADERPAGMPFDKWMFSILRSSWTVRWRANGAWKPAGEAEPEALDGIEYVDARFALQVVRDGFAELPEEERSVLFLVCGQGFAYKAAAEIEGVPVDTIKTRLARARLALYRRMIRAREGAGKDARMGGDPAARMAPRQRTETA